MSLSDPLAVNTSEPIAARLRFALLVPTCNPGPRWTQFLQALAAQTTSPDRVVFLDSESSDGTVVQSLSAGYEVWPIQRSQFSHGGTRQFGVQRFATEMDAVVFMTQDAVLAHPQALQNLLKGLEAPGVAAVWGRQLPTDQATAVAAHARLFNYPSQGRSVSIADREHLGLRACFLSHSFAAYRVDSIQAAGGFDPGIIQGEDMHMAARLLISGAHIQYQADACVYHFHNYSWRQDLARYFDTGVFHASQPWLLETFGTAAGEGWRYLRSEMAYLLANAPARIPDALARSALKLAGYHLGRRHGALPGRLCQLLSMQKGYWT
jgi:rhamnosyltransferase